MLRLLLAGTAIAILLMALSGEVLAQGWQWPSQMTVGGFNVTGISGRINADGSGTATGMLQIPGLGSHRIDLQRSARGDVTGSASLSLRASGAEIQGPFTLGSSGLKGQGTIKCGPKPITEASVSITPGGQVTGTGRVTLNRASIPTSFAITGGSFSAKGSASVQDEQNTALANYRFSGTVTLQSSSGQLTAVANGQVTRRGKLADQPTTYNISNARVDVASGRCTVNAGGVNVTFVF